MIKEQMSAPCGLDCSACPYFPCVHYLDWTLDTPHHQEAMATLIDRQKDLPF